MVLRTYTNTKTPKTKNMKGINTVKEIAQSIDVYGIDKVPLTIIAKTRSALLKLKKQELVALAQKCQIITNSANGKLLEFSKDEWVGLIAQYSHLLVI